MIKVAITGSVGMGKSTVAAMFERLGIPVFDADAEVHLMQQDGGSLVAPIAARFPAAVHAGHLDREMLRSIVLADREALAALEAIVHPAVAASRARFIDRNAARPIVAFDIPLLFETGGEADIDHVVVVSAGADIQRERVLNRAGMSEERLRSILARQMPDADKRARADFVVDTAGTIAATEAQVRAIVACFDKPGDS